MQKAPATTVPGNTEHRRIPRIPVNFHAVLICNGKKFHCDARNLSEAGILLATSHKEIVGQDVQLQLTFSPERCLDVAGTVIYIVPSGIGVRFRELSPEDRSALQAYLQAHGIGLLKP